MSRSTLVAKSQNERPNRLAILILLIVMAAMLLRQFANPSLGYPDAAALLMDGVFLLDFIRELPLTRIYDFTINYYGQYPSLSIGYRPPFFPFMEALFNFVFGINMWSSRLAILAFALVGVISWYLLVLRIYDKNLAFWTTLLFVTNPFVVQWGWYTMGEIPVLSMVMFTGYIFYRYIETENSGYLFGTAILFSLSVWTKQTAVFILLWFILYQIFTGTLIRCLRRKETYIAAFIVSILVLPLVFITFWLGEQNLSQSIAYGENESFFVRYDWDGLKTHLKNLINNHVTLPVLVFGIIGAGLACLKKDTRAVYFALLIICTYIFFTSLNGKNARYSIFWIPSFCLFAALPLFYTATSKRLSSIIVGSLACLVVYQIVDVISTEPRYATGYDKAARYILDHSNSPTVFVDAYNHGYFTYFMRAMDDQKSMYVLRADKLLSSSSISFTNKLKIHVLNRDGIKDIFDRYGIEYIVLEKNDNSGIKIHQELRDFLKEGPFSLMKRIVVESNRIPLRGQEILIYKYEQIKQLSAEYLELRLPVVGQTIKVPMRR